MQAEKSVFIYKDEDGELVMDKTNGHVLLKLASEKDRIRKIGWIARNTDGVISYYKEDEEKNVFRKTDAWSINFNVFKFLPSEHSTINIKTEKAIYRISKGRAMEVGSFLHFKQSGIELKFYISREFFTKEDI